MTTKLLGAVRTERMGESQPIGANESPEGRANTDESRASGDDGDERQR
jgi:hypothetical protein